MQSAQSTRLPLFALGLGALALGAWLFPDRAAPANEVLVLPPPAEDMSAQSLDVAGIEEPARLPASASMERKPVSSLAYEVSLSSTTTARFAGEEHVFHSAVSGRLEITCRALLKGAIEADLSLAVEQLSLPVSSLAGFEDLDADVRREFETPWFVRFGESGAELRVDEESSPARTIAAKLLQQLLQAAPISPAASPAAGSEVEMVDSLGRYLLALREVDGELEAEKLRYVSCDAEIDLEVEVLASTIQGERESFHGWIRTVHAAEELELRHGEAATMRRSLEVDLVLLEVADGEVEHLLATQGEDRRAAILRQLASLADALEYTDPALFSAMEELSHLFRLDPDGLAETIADMRGGSFDDVVRRLVLQAMGCSRVPEATAFLIDHAENGQIAVEERSATLAALATVRPDFDALQVLDPSLGLDPTQQRILLRGLLLPAESTSDGSSLLAMEGFLSEAGLSSLWLEALTASGVAVDVQRVALYLEHPDAKLRAAACENLGAQGGAEALRSLAAKLGTEEDGYVRRTALRVLAASVEDADIDLLATSLRTERNGEIRKEAVNALADGVAVGPAALALLRDIAANDTDDDVREAAEMALGL